MVTAAKDKKTSTNGLVEPEPFGNQGRLFDFDIEGSTLKPKHIAFLESLLNKAKATPDAQLEIVIGGTADSLGQGVFDNQALSQRRAQAVENFLRSRLPPNATFRIAAFGDGAASAKNGAGVRDDFFRAVDVAFIPEGAPTPQKPRLPGPAPRKPGEFPKPEFSLTCVREFEMPRSTDFSVRIESAPFGTLARFILLMQDNTNRLEAQYNFNGADAVFVRVVPLLFAAGSITPGTTKFKSFKTEFATRVTEFQTAVIKSGLGANLANVFDSSAPPVIALTYKSEDGLTHSAESELDFATVTHRTRNIHGVLTMESKCGLPGESTRGAKKLDGGLPIF